MSARLAEYQEDGSSVSLVASEVCEFVQSQSEQVGPKRVLGSTEVLESLIGKGKQLMGRTKNGYTKMVLGIAASVVTLSVQTVTAAFAAVKVADVSTWVAQKVGTSIQSLRQRILKPLASGTKTGPGSKAGNSWILR